MDSLERQRPSGGGAGGGGLLLLAALTVATALLGAFLLLPLLYVTPVPLAVLVYRHGYRPGILTAAVTLIIIGAGQQRLFGNVALTVGEQSWHILFIGAMTIFVTIGLIGIVIGGAWREGASRWQTLWLSTGAALAPMLLLWFVLKNTQNVDLIQVAFDSWSAVMRMFVDEAVAGGLAGDTAGMLREMISETEEMFPSARAYFPATMFIVGLTGAFVNSGLASFALSRDERRPPALGPFWTWRLPVIFASLFIIGYGLIFLAQFNAGAQIVGDNLVIATGFVCMVQGVVALVRILRGRNVGIVLQLLLAITLLLWLPVVLTWAGVIDMWLGARQKPMAT